ncbi:unnamed protein product [Symbiodinium microadriaticum]|nr:unnamed protein product [Symbiodinium sp. KB8]CAE7364283.1 unnamed protein product [Symbiodinium microadriaticum]
MLSQKALKTRFRHRELWKFHSGRDSVASRRRLQGRLDRFAEPLSRKVWSSATSPTSSVEHNTSSTNTQQVWQLNTLPERVDKAEMLYEPNIGAQHSHRFLVKLR